MKSFKQFSEQAYESYELVEGPVDYLKGKVKDQYQSLRNSPAALRSAVSAFKSDPVGSLKAGGMGLGKMTAKGFITDPIAARVKKATGNNPVSNLAIDTAADMATITPWRETAKKIATKVATKAPQLARTFGKNLLVRGPQTALKIAQGLGTLAGVGSRLN
jgi:hypothetical protein